MVGSLRERPLEARSEPTTFHRAIARSGQAAAEVAGALRARQDEPARKGKRYFLSSRTALR